MRRDDRAIHIRRMRAIVEGAVIMIVTFAPAMIVAPSATMTIATLGFGGSLTFDAQDGDFDAAIRQLTQKDVYRQFLADGDVRDRLFLAGQAHAGAVGDLEHVSEIVDLQRDGLAVFVDGHDLARQRLLHGFLRGRRCGGGRSGRFILRPYRLGSASGQRQQQAEDNGCFDDFHCGVAVDGWPRRPTPHRLRCQPDSFVVQLRVHFKDCYRQVVSFDEKLFHLSPGFPNGPPFTTLALIRQAISSFPGKHLSTPLMGADRDWE